jgi:hypothetical protein
MHHAAMNPLPPGHRNERREPGLPRSSCTVIVAIPDVARRECEGP